VIKIDRERKDQLENVIIPSEKWIKKSIKETDKVIKKFKRDKNFKFKANPKIYGCREVRKCLDKLFYGKCAYCEWKPTRSFWDVEHFRPKSRVHENDHHKGYYWLAYNWNNLYLSCHFCNRSLKDEKSTLGKSDHFPLEDENNRSYTPDSPIINEQYLLIDPCSDNPEKYLEFNITGEPIAIDNNKKAIESIKIYNLGDIKTNRLREAKINQYLFYIDALQTLKSILNEPIEKNKRKDIENKIKDIEKRSNKMLKDEEGFSGAIRSINMKIKSYIS
jgi:uncharacterized protein (TIGR02646 family)